MTEVLLLTGSNKGDRRKSLEQALELLSIDIISDIKKSSIYESEPWGDINQSNFLNQAILGNTVMKPMQLMNSCLAIESRMGRVRKQKYDPREIDIDILFFGTQSIDLPMLSIPHPQITNRKFALIAASEIASNWIHPNLNLSINELLRLCNDKLKVWKWQPN